MSLETLLEAARYVEQQELRAKQQQLQQQQRVAFRVMSPSALNTVSTAAALPAHQPPPPPTITIQLPRTPPLAPSAPAAAPPLQPPPPPPTTPAATHRPPQLVLTTTQQQAVNELLKPQVTVQPQPLSTTITNGFEKPLPQLIVDENQQQDLKKRHMPSVIKSGTREVHNKLEKNRRAHLKECFELLKKQLPPQQDEKKSSNLSILHSALRYIQVLKKKERENEHEMERLAREKIAAQQRLAALKKELGAQWDNIDFNSLIPEQNATVSTTSAVNVKEERTSDTEDGRISNPTSLQPAQLSVHLPIPQVGYPVSQGLVVGLHKVALVSKSLPLVTSPLTHIIATPPQLNGKVVPLVNAQYLMKPVVVVSTASPGGTTISPRPS